MHKQYIRLDDKNNIVYGFSDVFEKLVEGDIEYGNSLEGHFSLFNKYNPSLTNILGIYLYKYVNETAIKKTDEEIRKEIGSLPQPKPTPTPTNEDLQEEIIVLDSKVTHHSEILDIILPPEQLEEEVPNE